MILIQISEKNCIDKVISFIRTNCIDCNIKYIEEDYEEMVDDPSSHSTVVGERLFQNSNHKMTLFVRED